MVTDHQVRKLMQSLSNGAPLSKAALRAGMDQKTARKYRCAGQLPAQLKVRHTWRTRLDPFDAVWPELAAQLQTNPGLQAKSLFDDLQRRYPGRFADGQLRTLQRRLKLWRTLEGPPKEVFFAQQHRPGELCASDFCHLSSLGITVQGQPFSHLLYHFVLTYSNWETGSLCFAASALPRASRASVPACRMLYGSWVACHSAIAPIPYQRPCITSPGQEASLQKPV
jgi:hypothetical protein